MTTLDPGVTGRRRQGSPRAGRHKKKKPKAKKKPIEKKAGAATEEPVTRDPPEGSPVMSIPGAGKRYFGLSRNGSYNAAERGDFGILMKIGRRKYVVIAAVEARIKAIAEAAAVAA